MAEEVENAIRQNAQGPESAAADGVKSVERRPSISPRAWSGAGPVTRRCGQINNKRRDGRCSARRAFAATEAARQRLSAPYLTEKHGIGGLPHGHGKRRRGHATRLSKAASSRRSPKASPPQSKGRAFSIRTGRLVFGPPLPANRRKNGGFSA